MTLPRSDTRVDYDRLSLTARVLHAGETGDGRFAIVTDASCAHPVDAAWPDQGADAGVLRVDGRELALLDVVVAATDGETLYLEPPVRKGTEGWAFLVAHLVAEGIEEGASVEIVVDGAHRAALSVGHTACHLAALALNGALAGRWSKETRADALGAPDFDGQAIESSRIGERGSADRYRLNKSLRRKGFTTEGLDLVAVADAVNAQLAAWVAADAPVRVDRAGDGLADRRAWVCALPEGEARIPCGGTHVSSLRELGGASVTLELADEGGTPVLTMTTRAPGRAAG